jgi:glycosyltransferase involved in cell wall biosynthesis
MKSDPTGPPDILIEPSAMYPPLSGVGYYSRELLKAYSVLPGRFPMKILSYRFFLKSRTSAAEKYLETLAGEIGATVEIRRRTAPSAVHHRLRGRALRSPFPVDLAGPGGRRIYFFPNYVGAPLLRSSCIPVIYDLGFIRHPESHRAKDHLYLRRYLPRTLRRASRIVVISETIKRELREAFPIADEKIAVIHPAVDHTAFRPDIPPEARAAVRAKYSLPGPYLFSLSTLEPRKNFPGLVEAYALLPADIRNGFPLVVAGAEGWKNEALFAAIRRLGLEDRVKFLGYVPDADRAPLMREAGLFVFPSLYEGFGMPVLEAMACGTPVVTTERGAIPEVGGEAVVYADPLDPQSIAREMAAVLANPALRRRQSAAGPLRAAAFRWEASARRLAGVFESAARDIP